MEERRRAHDRESLAGTMVMNSLAAMELLAVYLGERLGLYRGLAALGWATATELAARSGTCERYVREWLEQQTVAGVLAVDDETAPAERRRYRLPTGHADVLLDRESPAFLAPLARFTVALAGPLERLLEAFRTGRGVPYPAYGVDAREGQGDLKRGALLASLGQHWLPRLPEVHTRLSAGPAARVADIACGTGWSSIALARAYPKVTVDAIDVDAPSIALARQNAAEAGVADRVLFQVQDAVSPGLVGPYDLVTVFEAVHELPRPVEALAVLRTLAADGGTVLVADERVGDEFHAQAEMPERLAYASSVLFCLPTSMASTPTAATGALLRPHQLRAYAEAAGFARVELLPIEAPFWWFYRLT